MSVNYELTIAGTTDYRAVAQRALPDAHDRLEVVKNRRRESLDGEFYADQGIAVSLAGHTDGHVEADSGTEQWIWKPGNCVNLTFFVDKSQIALASVAATQIVARILATGQEDLAYVQNYDVLLLTRIDGVVRKYHRDTWWAAYDGLNVAVPD